jgi:hypothetical protein
MSWCMLHFWLEAESRMALNFCAHLGLILLVSRQAHIICTKLKAERDQMIIELNSLIDGVAPSKFLLILKGAPKGLSSLCCYREAQCL